MIPLMIRSTLAMGLLLWVVTPQSIPPAVPVEVIPVLELPVAISDTSLVKTKNGFLLKCVLSNSSEYRQLGLRYSLAIVDSMNVVNAIVTRNDGFKLAPYETRNVTFRTPIKLKVKQDERVVLMLEQVVDTDFVWEVIRAKELLTAYLRGDYSTTPRVLRVRNQVDAPFTPRVIY